MSDLTDLFLVKGKHRYGRSAILAAWAYGYAVGAGNASGPNPYTGVDATYAEAYDRGVTDGTP